MIDFYDFTEGYKGNIRLLFITDKLTIIIWDYYLSDKTVESIILAVTR